MVDGRKWMLLSFLVSPRIYAKTVWYYVLRSKEVKHYAALGGNPFELQGLQVIVSIEGGVITNYRFHSISHYGSYSRKAGARIVNR